MAAKKAPKKTARASTRKTCQQPKRPRGPLRAVQRRRTKRPRSAWWEVWVTYHCDGDRDQSEFRSFMDGLIERIAKRSRDGSGYDETGCRDHSYIAANHKAAVALALRLVEGLQKQRGIGEYSVSIRRLIQ